MNTRRLMIIGFVGLLLFVASLSLLAAASASTDASAILPARAPAPFAVEAKATAPVEVVGQRVAQAAPQPQPVPVAPGSAEHASSTARSPFAVNGLLLLWLIASTVVLALVLMVWRQVGGERLDGRPSLAKGI